jgi:hypothetical protein
VCLGKNQKAPKRLKAHP